MTISLPSREYVNVAMPLLVCIYVQTHILQAQYCSWSPQWENISYSTHLEEDEYGFMATLMSHRL